MKIEIDYFYGCAICKVDGVLLHKCNDKVEQMLLRKPLRGNTVL